MPTPTYTPLANITLGSSAASVTFSSISQAYRDLVLVIRATTSSTPEGYIRFNSDTGSGKYPLIMMRGDGASTDSATDTSATFMNYSLYNALGGSDSMAVLNIMDYSATDKHKTVLARANRAAVGTSATAGRWASTSAITTITLTWEAGISWVSGDTVALYGVAA